MLNLFLTKCLYPVINQHFTLSIIIHNLEVKSCIMISYQLSACQKSYHDQLSIICLSKNLAIIHWPHSVHKSIYII